MPRAIKDVTNPLGRQFKKASRDLPYSLPRSIEQIRPRTLQSIFQAVNDLERRVSTLAIFQFLEVSGTYVGEFRQLFLRKFALVT